eukprot:scaffold149_cov315-Pinguiococcus_pyrenoidosus.AAC.32
MLELAYTTEALPLQASTTSYAGAERSTTWDQSMIFGCVCDSSWPVGLASGQRQEPEWFGPDCSMRHCPSGNDPDTAADETNCQGVRPAGSPDAGAAGNLCQVDCSNRGICNHEIGECDCFTGYHGENCNQRSALAK